MQDVRLSFLREADVERGDQGMMTLRSDQGE